MTTPLCPSCSAPLAGSLHVAALSGERVCEPCFRSYSDTVGRLSVAVWGRAVRAFVFSRRARVEVGL